MNRLIKIFKKNLKSDYPLALHCSVARDNSEKYDKNK